MRNHSDGRKAKGRKKLYRGDKAGNSTKQKIRKRGYGEAKVKKRFLEKKDS